MSHPAPGGTGPTDGSGQDPYGSGGDAYGSGQPGDAYGSGQPGDGHGYANTGAPQSAGSPYESGQNGAVPPPGGEPPKKRGLLPWILGCGGCLVLLLIAAIVGGIIWIASTSGTTTDPTPSPDTTTEPETTEPETTEPETTEPETTEPETTDPETDSALPELPGDVEGYTTTDTTPEYANYTDESADTYDAVSVTHMTYGTLESSISIIDNPQEYGNWTCGDFSGSPLCVAELHGGVVQTLSVTMDEQELADWSQAFEEAWQ